MKASLSSTALILMLANHGSASENWISKFVAEQGGCASAVEVMSMAPYHLTEEKRAAPLGREVNLWSDKDTEDYAREYFKCLKEIGEDPDQAREIVSNSWDSLRTIVNLAQ